MGGGDDPIYSCGGEVHEDVHVLALCVGGAFGDCEGHPYP